MKKLLASILILFLPFSMILAQAELSNLKLDEDKVYFKLNPDNETLVVIDVSTSCNGCFDLIEFANLSSPVISSIVFDGMTNELTITISSMLSVDLDVYLKYSICSISSNFNCPTDEFVLKILPFSSGPYTGWTEHMKFLL